MYGYYFFLNYYLRAGHAWHTIVPPFSYLFLYVCVRLAAARWRQMTAGSLVVKSVEQVTESQTTYP